MQEIVLKIRYFERGLSKSLKKVNFIFPFEPNPKIMKNKRGLKLVVSHSSGPDKNHHIKHIKQVQINSLISDVLPDQACIYDIY